VARGIRNERHWWQPGQKESPPGIPYEVACVCGKIAHGFRQAHHQEVPCKGCGKIVFILPYSPFIALQSHSAKARKSLPPGSRFWKWRWSLLVAATLLLAIGGMAYIIYGDFKASSASKEINTFGQYYARGQRALAQGKFQLATENLEAAWNLRDRHRENLPVADRREILQLLRQARLLADLSAESLEEILHHAADLVPDEREWQREFTRRYQGKAILFDTEVRPDPVRKFQMGYAVFIDAKRAKIDLSNVELFRLLPMHKPERLIFGLRLADITLEAEGIWGIRFEPNSGVLLTSLEAAAACCPHPVDELREVIDRQALLMGNNP
jgi:hypothetical protein